MKHSLTQYLNQLSTDRWARQGIRTLLRTAALATSIWCIGLGGRLLWDWPFRVDLLGALSLAIIGVGVLLLLRPKLSPQQAARRLDQRFHLDEQLATALEVAATKPPPGSVGARLVAQSDNTARLLRQRIARRQRPPWNELITLLALLPVAVGLFILAGIGNLNLSGSALPLPPLAPAQDPAQQFPDQPAPDQQSPVLVPGQGAEGQAPGTQPGAAGQPGASGQPGAAGDQRTIEALADALRDQGATRSAAEALDRNDLGGAAQQLRELADQASQLSQDARNDLADDLRDAAEQIAPRDPALADQLRQSADGLEEGGQAASEALDDLAQAIDDLQNGPPSDTSANAGQGEQGEQASQPGGSESQPGQEGQAGQSGEAGQDGQAGQGGGPGGAGNGSTGEQRSGQPSARLGVPGQPVPLEAEGPGSVPAEPSDRQPTTSEIVPGTTGGETSSDRRVRSGADPLRVPLDERDVVQEYFQPSQ
jgi:hypothetical protein